MKSDETEVCLASSLCEIATNIGVLSQQKEYDDQLTAVVFQFYDQSWVQAAAHHVRATVQQTCTVYRDYIVNTVLK